MESFFLSLFTLVIVAGFSGGGVSAASRSKMSGVLHDASDITWAHAVNSRDALEKALDGPINFLEADISLGHVVGNEGFPPMPIMAHPPETTSDISLDTWLSTLAARRPDKGVKLDFKSLEVLEPSLLILQKYSSKLNSSVWLNADVLSGPVNSSATPVLVETFLSLCQLYFPNATLSIGWTTYWYPTLTTEDSWHYGWQHVRRMADVIRCRYGNIYPKFTFPVRGIFASRSIKELQWLLSIIPNSTLTVWTGKHDPLQLEDLLRIRSSFPKDRVYYDVPENINDAFRKRKNSIDPTTYNFNVDKSQWMIVTKGQGKGCSALTYTKNDAIVLGKSLTSVVLRKKLIFHAEKDTLKVTGRVKFFQTDAESGVNAATGMQELSIVLTDVSLFSKNVSGNQKEEFDLTSSDAEVIWSAINSSTIYTFKHKYAEEDSSCRLFKLDTTEDKSFQVWEVPCDKMQEESSFENLIMDGIPAISSKKRLVLPKSPFMLGFMSTGEEHVVIYDLELKGPRETPTSASNSLRNSLGFTLFVLMLCVFCVFL